MTYEQKVRHTYKLIEEATLICKGCLEIIAEENERLLKIYREGLEKLRLQKGDFRPSDIIGINK